MTLSIENAALIRRWTQGLVISLLFISALGVTAWVRRPQPEPAAVVPAIPSLPALVGVPVHFSEELFRSMTAPKSSTPTPTKVDVASATTAQWAVKGIDVGPPPRAYLSEVGGTRSIWVSEGDRAGPLTIKRIEPGQVTVESSDGESILRF